METRKAKLKARLEKALRRPVHQAVFDKFDGFGGPIEKYFEGSLEHEAGEKGNFQALKGIFRDELDYLKRVEREKEQTLTASAAGDERFTSLIEPESSDSYVGTRACAISEVWAALADERPDVTEFRQTVLGGRMLSPKRASIMLDAPGDMLDELRELELRKLGSILANDYYGWDEEGAIWYVLTGKAPRLRPVRIRARGKLPVAHYVPFQYDVTFSVLPWVSAKEVERAYRNVQQQLLEETTPRETGPRILEVVQFWWEQFRTRGPMPSWPAWFELWNQTHPDKKFKKWRNFREYFFRGTKAAQPHYKRFPQAKLSAQEQQEMHAAEDYTIKAVQGYRKIGDRYIEATFE
jgi:hypothetical protein